MRDLIGKTLDHGGRKIWLQKTIDQVPIVDQWSVLETFRQVDLGKRGNDGELGARQPWILRAPLVELIASGERVLALSHQAALLDRLHQIAKRIRVDTRAPLLEAERQHLAAVVAQHALGDLVGARGEHVVALAE